MSQLEPTPLDRLPCVGCGRIYGHLLGCHVSRLHSNLDAVLRNMCDLSEDLLNPNHRPEVLAGLEVSVRFKPNKERNAQS